jgi:hypothetical protein
LSKFTYLFAWYHVASSPSYNSTFSPFSAIIIARSAVYRIPSATTGFDKIAWDNTSDLFSSMRPEPGISNCCLPISKRKHDWPHFSSWRIKWPTEWREQSIQQTSRGCPAGNQELMVTSELLYRSNHSFGLYHRSLNLCPRSQGTVTQAEGTLTQAGGR